MPTVRILLAGPRSRPLDVLGDAIAHWPGVELVAESVPKGGVGEGNGLIQYRHPSGRW